jgi:tRNA-2-methylthio-N6-dimethylallyladenosine synthase
MTSADLIILNTCSVREKASNKVFSELGRIRDKKKPDALFGIVGCVAREEGMNAFRRIPELNFVLGPQSYHKITDIIENPDARLLNIDLSGLEKFDEVVDMQLGKLGVRSEELGVNRACDNARALKQEQSTPNSSLLTFNSSLLTPNLSYIPIQEGCDHCCSYCIVPFTRGPELSRPFDDVMRDVQAAANAGAIEICFLGQNVNGYKYQLGVRSEELGVNRAFDNTRALKQEQSTPHSSLLTPNSSFLTPNSSLLTPNFYALSDLIRATARIKSVQRIRFTSSYPTEMSDELIDLFRTEPKLIPFVNMPIQSGSSDVLTRMNRPYSVEEYVNIVEKLRAARSDIQISSDFIVGFPGETEEDFEATLEVARRIRYINSYTFKYSPRPHTAAAIMKNQIPENIKRQRLKALDEVLTEINREFNESCLGLILPCLIEGPDKTGKHLIARTPYMQQVIVPAAQLQSAECRACHPKPWRRVVQSSDNCTLIKVTAANKCSLRGEIISTILP